MTLQKQAEAFSQALDNLLGLLTIRGGPGSGHRGHRGRPGEVGGSEPGKGAPRARPSAGAVAQAPGDIRAARKKRLHDLYKRMPDTGSVRRSKVSQEFFAAATTWFLDREVEINLEEIDSVSHSRGFRLRDDSGNVLTVQLGEAVWTGFKPELILSWIDANNKGTGLGSAFMRACKSYADAKDMTFRVVQVTNPKFYQRFDWLEKGHFTEFFYDPTKQQVMVPKSNGEDEDEYDLRESPHDPKGKQWPLILPMVKRGGPGSAYFNVVLDDDLVDKQREILGQLNGLEPVPSDRLHITLLYIEQCDRRLLEAMAAGLSKPLRFDVEITGLKILGEESDYLTLTVNPSPGLIRLHDEVLTLAAINGLPISDYSKNDQYKPHISIAQGDLSNITLPDIEPFKIGVVGVQASIEDFEIVHVAPLRERDYPAPHCGPAPGEHGGSQPRDECAPGQVGKRIVKILGVIDTREYVEDEEGRFKPVGGTGEAHECERCGKWHEVHAHVELEDGSIIVVGTACAKAEFGEMERKQMASKERAAKRLAKLEAEAEAKLAGREAWDNEYAVVAQLPMPEINLTEGTDSIGKPTIIADMGDARVWCGWRKGFDEERRETLIHSWRVKRMAERGYRITRPFYDSHYYEKEIAKVKKRAGQEIVTRDYPGDLFPFKGGPDSGHHGHRGRPGEVGGSLPKGATAIERQPDSSSAHKVLLLKAKELHNEGKFAMVTRDIKTGEYLLITDRETAIDKLGNDRRNDTRETLYVFSTQEMFFQKQGSESRIHLDGWELSDLQGWGKEAEHYGGTMVISHNHPAVLGEFMPPSPSDIYFSILANAGEMRTYMGDGDYVVRVEKFGNEALNELSETLTRFEDANFSARFPNINREWSLRKQKRFIMQNSLADELKEYQLERLDHIVGKLDWLSYEFKPTD